MSNEKLVETKKILGGRIKELRGHYGLTLEAFAAPLSIKGPSVNDYEHGRARASESVIRELETHYRLNRNWYDSGEGNMLRPKGITDIDSPIEEPSKVSEQLTGYSRVTRMTADYFEEKSKGMTAGEQLKLAEEIMDKIRERVK